MIESVKLAMLEAENLQLRKLLWLNHGRLRRWPT